MMSMGGGVVGRGRVMMLDEDLWFVVGINYFHGQDPYITWMGVGNVISWAGIWGGLRCDEQFEQKLRTCWTEW